MSDFPIWIPGTPVPQGSKTAGLRGKRVIMWDANAAKLKPWRETMTAHLVAWQATWMGAFQPYDGPLEIDVTFWMPRPGKPKFHHPAVPPDDDKLQRALGDSLTDSGVVVDDSRITTWHARKRYSNTPGITIHAIREDTSMATDAHAEAEPLVDDIVRWDDTIATEGPCDGTWDSLAEYLIAQGWARDHLAAQKSSAWDEGFVAGWAEHADPGAFVNDVWDAETPNPYRTETTP